MSYNSGGFGFEKRKDILSLCIKKDILSLYIKHSINFLGLQETHLRKTDLVKVRLVWGNYQFVFASSPAQGRSGSIL